MSWDVPGQSILSRDFCSCPCPGIKGQWDVPSLGKPTYSLVLSPCRKNLLDETCLTLGVTNDKYLKHNFDSPCIYKNQKTGGILQVSNSKNLTFIRQQKYDNLQYNTMAWWLAGTNDSSTKRLMFQGL